MDFRDRSGQGGGALAATLELGEPGQQLVVHAVGEYRVLRVDAATGEGQHGDRCGTDCDGIGGANLVDIAPAQLGQERTPMKCGSTRFANSFHSLGPCGVQVEVRPKPTIMALDAIQLSMASSAI
jgi:hypothetical protein